MVLVASPKTGVKNLAEFMKLTKANPGKYSYGSSGVGTALHLAGEMVKDQGGLFMTHIPYRGVAPLANDLLGSNIEFGVFVLSSGLPHIKSGKVVALGTTERAQRPRPMCRLSEHPAAKHRHAGRTITSQMPEPVVANEKALAESLQSPEVRKS
jgi:tripartite-type tricarboxylate transporter receptor subunit TctC